MFTRAMVYSDNEFVFPVDWTIWLWWNIKEILTLSPSPYVSPVWGASRS
jgi:hypothetical protein